MAIDTYSLTYADVDIPGVDTAYLPATDTETLSQADLTDYLEEGASDVFAELQRRDLEKSDLSEQGVKIAQRCIKTYATTKALKRLGHSGDNYNDAQRDYERAWSMWLTYADKLAGQTGLSLTNVAQKADFTFVQDRDLSRF